MVEWLRSLTCNQMTKTLSHKFFSQDANNLILIGKLIAADIALNNSKRFPCSLVWPESKGVITNLLFVRESIESNEQKNWDIEESVQFDSIAAIDNQVLPIKPESPEMRSYLKRIDSFVATVLAESIKVAEGANA